MYQNFVINTLTKDFYSQLLPSVLGTKMLENILREILQEITLFLQFCKIPARFILTLLVSFKIYIPFARSRHEFAL